MVDSGNYCLLLRLRRATTLTIPARGTRRIPAGWYVYVGSAKSRLSSRIARHWRMGKPHHWHIDYLREVAVLQEVWVWPWRPGRECRLGRHFLQAVGASNPWPGFGASDCRCGGHLIRFPALPLLPPGGRRNAPEMA